MLISVLAEKVESFSILLSRNVSSSEFLGVRCVLLAVRCAAPGVSAWAAACGAWLPGLHYSARTGPSGCPLYSTAAAQNTTQLDPDYDGNQRFASRVCNWQFLQKLFFAICQTVLMAHFCEFSFPRMSTLLSLEKH